MNFCCQRFKSRWELANEQGINIRIVRVNPNEVIDSNQLIRIYLTMGYTDFLADSTVLMPIAFCPFCATNLFEYYKNDFYLNELTD